MKKVYFNETKINIVTSFWKNKGVFGTFKVNILYKRE